MRIFPQNDLVLEQKLPRTSPPVEKIGKSALKKKCREAARSKVTGASNP
jgi:hypothetical protein